MDISTNLTKKTDTGYIYSIHSTPLNYVNKLMSAGSKSGKVVFKGDSLHVKTECKFYSWNEFKRFVPTSIEAIYIYFEAHLVLIDCIQNRLILDSQDEKYVLRVLTILHTDDKNIDEVWQDLLGRMIQND